MYQPLAKQKTNFPEALVIALLLLAGLYFPSSIAGNISKSLNYVAYAFCSFLLGFVLLRNRERPYPILIILAISSLSLLVVFSFFSGLHQYTPGALVPYFVFGLLSCCNLRELAAPNWTKKLFIAVNVVNIGFGFAIIAGNAFVDDYLTNFYSAYYPELVQNMLDWHKPVLTFGTHSLAAFYLYLFFYCNLRTFQSEKSRLFLLLAILNVVLILSLLSVSGVILAVIGIGQLLWIVRRGHRKWFWALAAFAVIGAPSIFGLLIGGVDSWSKMFQLGQAILTEPNSGWFGRFGGGGYMQYDLWYWSHNLFAPVGVSYRDELMFGDSGMFEYLLRGSILLLINMYMAYFLFLKRNVHSCFDRYFLFGAMIAFETGYSAMLSVRMLYLIAFIVIYLNTLGSSLGTSSVEPRVRI